MSVNKIDCNYWFKISHVRGNISHANIASLISLFCYEAEFNSVQIILFAFIVDFFSAICSSAILIGKVLPLKNVSLGMVCYKTFFFYANLCANLCAFKPIFKALKKRFLC